MEGLFDAYVVGMESGDGESEEARKRVSPYFCCTNQHAGIWISLMSLEVDDLMVLSKFHMRQYRQGTIWVIIIITYMTGLEEK